MRNAKFLLAPFRKTCLLVAAGPSGAFRRDQSRVAVKRLAVVRPDLVGEWVPELNDMDVATVGISATEVVTWRCSTCSHQWAASVRERAVGEAGCPECARRASSGIAALGGANSIAQTHPEAASQWDALLNDPLRPTDVSALSTRAVWWRSKDGKESFRRPVYAFLRDQRSLREMSVTCVEERVTALEHLSPLVGYGIPDSIRRVVEGFKSAPPNAETYLSRTSNGSLTIEELASFEELWCKQQSEARTARNAAAKTEVEFDVDALTAAKKKSKKLTLTLDTSLSPIAAYKPAVPVQAMLDYHGQQLLSAIEEARLHSSAATPLPSYLLNPSQAKEEFNLPEQMRARINARRVAANRLKFKSQRPFASEIKTREMPSMPSPDAILEAEVTGHARLEEVTSFTSSEGEVNKFRSRRGGFRKNQTLEMPEELDETPIALSKPETVPEEAAVAESIMPEVAAPAAPRVVGRRKKSS